MTFKEKMKEWTKPLEYEGRTDLPSSTPKDDPGVAKFVLFVYGVLGLLAVVLWTF